MLILVVLNKYKEGYNWIVCLLGKFGLGGMGNMQWLVLWYLKIGIMVNDKVCVLFIYCLLWIISVSFFIVMLCNSGIGCMFIKD